MARAKSARAEQTGRERAAAAALADRVARAKAATPPRDPTGEHPQDTGPGNDAWGQGGATLRLFFDERARTFEASLRPADLGHLSGSVTGGGTFTAEAVPTYGGIPY